MTETILDRIKTYKLQEVAADKATMPLNLIEEAARAADPVRGFEASLRRAQATGYGLIAEIKKASPSKGLIREDFDPATLAQAYERGGATCLSVLTDTPSFKGAKPYLSQARNATRLPAIRKDFIYDPYQVVEARSLHADCILLIMASIDDGQAAELEATAFDWGMDVLIEVHDAAELERAHKLKSRMIGVNNRNLHTFETSLETTKALAGAMPEDALVISESGLFVPEDLAEMAAVGVRSFLIGEALMRQADVEAATTRLLADPVV
ncbi:Indole-3-glycerol phosphate synthase [Roseivivax sp. THAF40]|uniref:indole-3-glycerol phosphate synthase TrpC n=1 Tax=unclassified Roseivivax TaxID=2639302 RepID=UPI001268B151|nr:MULTISPECIES: indole-3-glycerol phosphate synthase TrpC [unclassified Roseivivax]QFS83374.1 Indole-3-glycerol phosphate synthase [Roseivivax sp. THAF197b]QFT47118.1 Indole-3-glycerol phosphate synthase [Roseivivax sp. THAF40]